MECIMISWTKMARNPMRKLKTECGPRPRARSLSGAITNSPYSHVIKTITANIIHPISSFVRSENEAYAPDENDGDS